MLPFSPPRTSYTTVRSACRYPRSRRPLYIILLAPFSDNVLDAPNESLAKFYVLHELVFFFRANRKSREFRLGERLLASRSSSGKFVFRRACSRLFSKSMFRRTLDRFAYVQTFILVWNIKSAGKIFSDERVHAVHTVSRRTSNSMRG